MSVVFNLFRQILFFFLEENMVLVSWFHREVQSTRKTKLSEDIWVLLTDCLTAVLEESPANTPKGFSHKIAWDAAIFTHLDFWLGNRGKLIKQGEVGMLLFLLMFIYSGYTLENMSIKYFPTRLSQMSCYKAYFWYGGDGGL